MKVRCINRGNASVDNPNAPIIGKVYNVHEVVDLGTADNQYTIDSSAIWYVLEEIPTFNQHSSMFEMYVREESKPLSVIERLKSKNL